MSNYRIGIQYEGTKYQGWQRQIKTDNTIQGKVEAVLGKMLDQEVEIQASGRTDAGVHAKHQVFHVKMDTSRSVNEIRDYLNDYLPLDIRILDVAIAGERFHARLNVVGKEYQYRVWNGKRCDVFLRNYAYEVPEALDINKMREAAKYLEGEHDFQSFTSTKKGKKSTIRIIKQIKIEKLGEEILFSFFGNGFLYHMVRILVGTLIEVGKGKLEPESILDIVEAKNRSASGPLIPAKGLTLMQVFY